MLKHPQKQPTTLKPWEKVQLCENLKDILGKIDYLSIIQQNYKLTEEEIKAVNEIIGDYLYKAHQIISELENTIKGEKQNV